MPMQPIKKIPARDRILTSAHDLFYLYGIRATGIDRIIAESGVAKVTFYRHFPSKNDLIRAFLEYRHQRWISWFKGALERHGQDIHAIVPALAEWFHSEQFRGCAFINSVGELANELPEVCEITRHHKQHMIQVISELVPQSTHRDELINALAVAIDGAIIHAQYDTTPENALKAVDHIIAVLIP
ncbi:TetR/AcrR family transcriptional regulator [Amphritea sp. ZJ14W]|nr:TetR/AcrR family transcriptional regulator [Amphritea pacifica]